MSVHTLTQRQRDPRYPVPAGGGTIEFRDARRAGESVRGTVVQIGVAGITFELDDCETAFEAGELLSAVTLQFGACVLTGDIVVRSCRTAAASKVTVGGLFYPEAARCMDRMLGLLSGLSLRG